MPQDETLAGTSCRSNAPGVTFLYRLHPAITPYLNYLCLVRYFSRKQLHHCSRLNYLMKIWPAAASKMRDSAVQHLLELTRLFEAEALWESVEIIRAVLDRLRDWDLPAASRLFWQMDGSAFAAIPSGRTGAFIAERSAAVGSLLGSMRGYDASDLPWEN